MRDNPHKLRSTISAAAAIAVASGAASQAISAEASSATSSLPEPHFSSGTIYRTKDFFPGKAREYSVSSTRFTSIVATSNEWSREDEADFSKLALKEAFDELSESDKIRLEILQERRRLKRNPESGEMIIKRHRRDRLDEDLVAVFRKFVSIEGENGSHYP